ncbi:acyltransferase family protein [Polynucleobacter sp. MWH-UH19D]|uniref:acyltransferase family protein n=1 Tax=Polynucleobacter sp. MWH-UH19D TaxID=1855610 RepID=UPI003364FC0F
MNNPAQSIKQMANIPQLRSRNQLFDFYKGVAIILVVTGHTFQYIIYPNNFDESLGFRLIYSFHMPLFVFISGMISSYWILEFKLLADLKNNLHLAIQRFTKSCIRLILPFISWTIFKYFYYHMDVGILNYLYLTFQQPDESLWFLPCIFMCILFWVFAQILIASLIRIQALRRLFQRYLTSPSRQMAYQFIFILLIWLIVKNHLPHAMGDLLKNFFIYFFLGVVTSQSPMLQNGKWKRIIPYAAFILLAPLWHRNTVNHLPTSIHNLLSQSITKFYPLVIALSGSFAALDMSKILYEANLPLINKMVEYCGKISLGIYAIHFYILHIGISIISPLFISIAASTVILKIPVLRTLLLGEMMRSK